MLERLLPYLDNILFDLKHVDTEIHRAFTGLDNELILANLRQLVRHNAPITVRVPLIPGFNDTPASMQTITEFVQELNSSVTTLDLLPYHTLGRAKYKALGRDYPWVEYDRLTEAEVEELALTIEHHGLKVNIGG